MLLNWLYILCVKSAATGMISDSETVITRTIALLTKSQTQSINMWWTWVNLMLPVLCFFAVQFWVYIIQTPFLMLDWPRNKSLVSIFANTCSCLFLAAQPATYTQNVDIVGSVERLPHMLGTQTTDANLYMYVCTRNYRYKHYNLLVQTSRIRS